MCHDGLLSPIIQGTPTAPDRQVDQWSGCAYRHGVDLEEHAGQGECGDPDQGLGGQFGAPGGVQVLEEDLQLPLVVADDVGADADDVGGAEADGREGGAEVGEGPLDLTGEVVGDLSLILWL